MIQLALKLAELTVNELKTLARSIKQGLASAAGLAAFPTPKVTPANLEAGAKAVEDQEAVVGGVEADLAEQRGILQQKISALEDLVTAAGTDCLNVVSQLAEEDAKMKLASANIPVRSDRAPTPAAVKPTGFFVNRGDHDSEVDGGCDRQKSGKMYRVRYGASPSGPFTVGYEGTKSSFTISGLPVGDCWFQMAAFATNGGWSEWCDPARCHVV
jgi:hypothetical protein